MLYALMYGWETPGMSSPSDGTITYTGVEIDWYSVINSEQYQMQLDTTASFDSPVHYSVIKDYINSSSYNSDTEKHVENLFFGVKYYWRVRAWVVGDTSTWSTVWDFTTRDYVSLYTPSSGSYTYTGVTLDWNSHTGVDYYDMEVDTSLLFNSAEKRAFSKAYINSSGSNTDTKEYLEDLRFGTTYYWRVRARNLVDTSAWSTVWDFMTRDYVSLYTPSSGSTTYTGIELDWNSHTGVDYYDMEVDTSILFNSAEKRSFSKAYINSSNGNTDTQEYLDDLYFGTIYYWRVRARNAVDTSGWSTVWDFATRDYVSLDSPSSGSYTYTGVTLDWYMHRSVDYYDMGVDTTMLFNSPVNMVYSKAYINSSSNNSDTEQYLDDLYFGTTYYWRARARNAVDTSGWSTVWDFSTRDYVSLSYPDDGATNIPVNGITLDWYSHTGIDIYQLQYDTTNLFNSVNFVQSDKIYINSSSSNSDTRHSTGILKANTIYFWRVRVINLVDTSAWTTRAFNTGSDPIIYPDVPVLLSPNNNAFEQSLNPVLDWYDAANADSYIVEYDLSVDFNSPVSLLAYASEVQIFDLIINEEYFWRVRSQRNGIVSDWSVSWQFSTGLSTPFLLSPANDSTGTPIYNLNLDWSDVDHADGYMIEYSPDSTFVLGVITETSIGSDTTITNLLYETSYFWRVKALENSYSGDWSNVWKFTTRQNLNELQVDIHVYLQGPFFFTQMTPFLNFYNLIPHNQPFNTEPRNYTGPELVTTIPNADVVDWALVELRETSLGVQGATTETIVGKRAGFILKNGHIVDLDGISPLTFDIDITEDIYAVVWHRNHLGVMSNFPMVFEDGIYVYDFTSGPDQAYGGQLAHSEIEPGIWGMTAGDGDQDGQITNLDKVDLWEVQLGSQDYLNADYNINGFCDYPDKTNFWEINAGKGCHVIKTAGGK